MAQILFVVEADSLDLKRQYSYLASLYLTFLIRKMGIIKENSCWDDQVN